MKLIGSVLITLFGTMAARARLALTVSPLKVATQNAVVLMALTNGLTGHVESARAEVFNPRY